MGGARGVIELGPALMKVIQHRPGIFALERAPLEGEVGSIPELTQLEWVKNFWVAPGFYQFSRSAAGEEGYLLLAEYAGGRRAYVVAQLSGPDAERLTRVLPAWEQGVG